MRGYISGNSLVSLSLRTFLRTLHCHGGHLASSSHLSLALALNRSIFSPCLCDSFRLASPASSPKAIRETQRKPRSSPREIRKPLSHRPPRHPLPPRTQWR